VEGETEACRLLDTFADTGITTDAAFEEDQGVTPDDEETQEVEQGEFCKPPPPIIRKKPAPAGLATGGKGGILGIKRSNTQSDSERTVVSASPEEAPKKKKAKKA
jgi:hypothetical protein